MRKKKKINNHKTFYLISFYYLRSAFAQRHYHHFIIIFCCCCCFFSVKINSPFQIIDKIAGHSNNEMKPKWGFFPSSPYFVIKDFDCFYAISWAGFSVGFFLFFYFVEKPREIFYNGVCYTVNRLKMPCHLPFGVCECLCIWEIKYFSEYAHKKASGHAIFFRHHFYIQFCWFFFSFRRCFSFLTQSFPRCYSFFFCQFQFCIWVHQTLLTMQCALFVRQRRSQFLCSTVANRIENFVNILILMFEKFVAICWCSKRNINEIWFEKKNMLMSTHINRTPSISVNKNKYFPKEQKKINHK